MTTEYDFSGYDLDAPIQSTLSSAEGQFANATKITEGGISAAITFARGWMDRFYPRHYAEATEDRRAAIVARFARDALTAAGKIVADGRAYYRLAAPKNDNDILVVAYLLADASAGPTGYLPLRDIRKEA